MAIRSAIVRLRVCSSSSSGSPSSAAGTEGGGGALVGETGRAEVGTVGEIGLAETGVGGETGLVEVGTVGEIGRAEIGIAGGGEGGEDATENAADDRLALGRVGDLIGEWKFGSIGST